MAIIILVKGSNDASEDYEALFLRGAKADITEELDEMVKKKRSWAEEEQGEQDRKNGKDRATNKLALLIKKGDQHKFPDHDRMYI